MPERLRNITAMLYGKSAYSQENYEYELGEWVFP